MEYSGPFCLAVLALRRGKTQLLYAYTAVLCGSSESMQIGFDARKPELLERMRRNFECNGCWGKVLEDWVWWGERKMFWGSAAAPVVLVAVTCLCENMSPIVQHDEA